MERLNDSVVSLAEFHGPVTHAEVLLPQGVTRRVPVSDGQRDREGHKREINILDISA